MEECTYRRNTGSALNIIEIAYLNGDLLMKKMDTRGDAKLRVAQGRCYAQLAKPIAAQNNQIHQHLQIEDI